MRSWFRRRPLRRDRPKAGEHPTPHGLSLADLRSLAEASEPQNHLAAILASRDQQAAAASSPLDWAVFALSTQSEVGSAEGREIVDFAIQVHGRAQPLMMATLAMWTNEPAWQLLDVLREGADEMAGDLDWQTHLARAAQTVGVADEADAAYRRAEVLSDDPRLVAFRRGVMWQDHNRARAEEAFAHAIDLDEESEKPLGARALGIGIFYLRIGDQSAAIEAFEETARSHPDEPAIWLNIARAQMRRFDWPRAEAAARRCVDAAPDAPHGHIEVGLSLERQQRWSAAAASFARAVALEGSSAKRSVYRWGFCLAKSGDLDAAVEAYDHLPMPKPQRVLKASAEADKAFRLSAGLAEKWQRGHEAYAAAEWERAREAFADVAHRNQDHHPDLWAAYGKAAARTGAIDEAAQAFEEFLVFRQPEGLRVPRWEKSASSRRVATYAEFRERLAVDPRVIVWESFHGASVSCNPKALFDHVVDRPEFAGHTHVWAVEDDDQPLPPGLAERPNVVIAERDTHLYVRSLAVAGHLVTNTTFPSYFSRRPEQKYLNTWHGTPLKTLGIDAAPRGELVHANVSRNLLHATHLALPNSHTRDVLLTSNQVEGLLSARVALTGSPRLDRALNASVQDRATVAESLGLDPERPIVFFAPTWRSSEDTALGDPVGEAVHALAAVADAQVVVRFHHLDPARDRPLPASVVAAPDAVDTYDVLAACDVLVTDYSSLMFDFLPFGRPLVLYVPDLEQYTASRGLAMAIEDVPARRVDTAEGLVSAVQDAIGTSAAVIDDEPLVAHEDGAAAARVRRFFFEDESDPTETTTPSGRTVLIHCAMIPNGVTSSLLNLLSSIADSDVTVVLLVSQKGVRRDARRHLELERVPHSVRILAVPEPHTRTLEGTWIQRRLTRLQHLSTDAQWDAYWDSIEQDARRMLGDFRADAAVDFDGYAPYWASVTRYLGRRSIVYQHSTMYEEYTTRAPKLATQFEICRTMAPSLVSVSRPILEQNARDLAEHFDVPTDLYRLVPNQIDADRITSLADEPLDPDVAAWLAPDSIVFISIGRLSIEKNHALLVDAFARFAEAEPRARLLIVGSGFLAATLQSQVDRLGLTDRVFFAGQRANPFAMLRRADCLVMSSFHEGQPMVVLEAMVLGTRVLSTDLPGVRDMTRQTAAVFVDSDPESMAAGMGAVMAQDSGADGFDAQSYRQHARDTFLRVAAGTEPPALG